VPTHSANSRLKIGVRDREGMSTFERHGPGIIASQFVAVSLRARFSLKRSPFFSVTRISDDPRVCATDALPGKNVILRIPRDKETIIVNTILSAWNLSLTRVLQSRQ